MGDHGHDDHGFEKWHHSQPWLTLVKPRSDCGSISQEHSQSWTIGVNNNKKKKKNE